MNRRPVLKAGCLGLLLPGMTAHGHGERPAHARTAAPAPEQKPWGIAGNPSAVKRTIEIAMLDTMRFVPDRLRIREGETVRLRIRNRGKVLHELVLGTREELARHAEQMLKFPDMEHDEPHMAHVAAGRRGDLIWHFNRPGDFEFACLIPGHFQAGMTGILRVDPR